AMSRKRSHDALESYRARFVAGAARNGVDAETANRVYDKLVGFSGFGFPKSHAAAFGLLAYQSAWLRHHFPAEFLCGLLNEQPMGFYPPASLVRDAQRRGVEVLPADVNESSARCTLQPCGQLDPNSAQVALDNDRCLTPPVDNHAQKTHGAASGAPALRFAVRIGLAYVQSV